MHKPEGAPKVRAKGARLLLLLLGAPGVVTVTGAPPAAAAAKTGLCNVEAAFVDTNFGTGWTIGIDTASRCYMSKSPPGFEMVMNFTGNLEAPLSAAAEWKAGHTAGAREKVWLVPHLGRLAADGQSALGEIPGHGKVTAVLDYIGVDHGPTPDPNGVGLEIADGYSVVGVGISEWALPIGRSAPIPFPWGHKNAIQSLGARLVPPFYTKSKVVYS